MRRFVITGTGRCGTAWMSRALTVLGIRCEHEGVFNPRTLADGTWRARLDRRSGCSWLALPVLAELPADVAVFALVREPLAVIRSLMGIRFFSSGGEYAAIARSVAELPDDELEACAWFWIRANEIAAHHAEAVVRIEDPGALHVLASAICPGREFAPGQFDSVVRSLAPMNARERDESITLDMLKPYTRNALVDAAHRLGYAA